MKKIICLLVFVLLAFCGAVNAQNFLTHKVKEKETVQSIALKYNVAPSEIYDLNPDSNKGINTTMTLIIPKVSSVTPPTDSTVKKTEELVKEETKQFITHKVKRKETLYSLSKLYNVSQTRLKKYNPQLYTKSLRKGDDIRVPQFKETVEAEVSTPQVSTPVITSTEIPVQVVNDSVKTTLSNNYHLVQPREGKWRIAHRYGLSVEELKSLNPNMNPVLQVGDTLIVSKLEQKPVVKANEYTVLQSEGFYRIKIKTGVDKAVLEQLNPDLITTGLKPGMVLQLPKDTLLTPTEQVGEARPIDLAKLPKTTATKRIAILLPFKLNKIKLDSIKDTERTVNHSKLLNLTLDFYTGAKQALDSLSKLGINLDVKVFDTQNSMSKTYEIAQNLKTFKPEVVIGPLLPKNFNNLSETLTDKEVALISPLTKAVKPRANVYQSRPSDNLLFNKVVSYVKSQKGANIIIVHDSKSTTAKSKLLNAFPSAKIVKSRHSKKTQEDEFFVYETDLSRQLVNGNNIVFLETVKGGMVSNVSSILNSLKSDTKKIRLVTTDHTKAFDDDEVSNYHLSSLNFTFASVGRPFETEKTKALLKNYETAYADLPSEYAMRGFDVTLDAVLRISAADSFEDSVLKGDYTQYVENRFSYTNNILGGYTNQALYLLYYKDLHIEELKY